MAMRPTDTGPASSFAFAIEMLGRDGTYPVVIDDEAVAFARDRDLLVRLPGELQATLLHRSESPVDMLTTSPDGRWIAFTTLGEDQGLFRIQAAGGPAIQLSEGSAAYPVWAPDGFIYFEDPLGMTNRCTRNATLENKKMKRIALFSAIVISGGAAFACSNTHSPGVPDPEPTISLYIAEGAPTETR